MDEFRDCADVKHNSKYKHERTIIHIDLDYFYAQVEILKNPELATKPVGIKQQHYLITSNYIAREYGIKKCMTIKEAVALCPKLVVINGEDLHDYRNMSAKVTDVIRQFSNKVEKLGLDENFVDVSDLVTSKLSSEETNLSTVEGHVYNNELENICTCGCRERLAIGSHIAIEIRERIKEELGMTCCAGVGHNKLLAKLVGPTHKPNQQTTVFPCSALSLVSSLNRVRAIPGVGRKTSDVLDSLGIDSVYDVQNSSLVTLEKHLGKGLAYWIKQACFGVDDSDVKESGKPQVIGLEEASKKMDSMQHISCRLKSLIERGMVLLQEDGRQPTTIRVAVRKYRNTEYTRQRESKQCAINPSLLRSPTATEQILEIALSLFKKLVDHKKPFHLTLLGLAFTKFQEDLPVKNSLSQFLIKKPSENNESGKHCVNTCKSEITTVQNNTTSCSSSVGQIDEAFLNELPEDIKMEILQNCQSKPEPCPSVSQVASNTVPCPPGVNLEVFNELPYDIQIELSKDSYKSIPNTSTKTTPTYKKQNSILNYFKK